MLLTSESIFMMSRRDILKMLGIGAVAMSPMMAFASAPQEKSIKTTSEEYATTYNNFYEFGFSKSDPAKYGKNFDTSGWTISIDGDVKEKKVLKLSDIVASLGEESKIYKMRCVEGWSMVIPWSGFELNKLIKLANPNSTAKYVAFETVADPRMPEVADKSFPFPYLEGLRMDEAMHPLAFIATGAYGKPLLMQNGAPARLLVPWKYGFKSIKSITKITFLKEQPITTWSKYNSAEYGFYANVNPDVPHPRWSQAKERVLYSQTEVVTVPTLLFNGYAVDELYKGMDLKKDH